MLKIHESHQKLIRIISTTGVEPHIDSYPYYMNGMSSGKDKVTGLLLTSASGIHDQDCSIVAPTFRRSLAARRSIATCPELTRNIVPLFHICTMIETNDSETARTLFKPYGFINSRNRIKQDGCSEWYTSSLTSKVCCVENALKFQCSH